MPNTTGVIQNLETKDGIGKNDKPYKLYRLEIDSTWYSTFDESAGNYRPGDPVSFIYEEKPNPNGPNPYRNITGFLAGPTREEAASEGFLDPPPAAPRRDPTRASIERQTALKVAGELIVAEIGAGQKHDETSGPQPNILVYAQLLYNWLSESSEKPEAARTEPQAPQQPTDTLEGSDEPFPGGEPW
jgi:hypothetical protein